MPSILLISHPLSSLFHTPYPPYFTTPVWSHPCLACIHYVFAALPILISTQSRRAKSDRDPLLFNPLPSTDPLQYLSPIPSPSYTPFSCSQCIIHTCIEVYLDKHVFTDFKFHHLQMSKRLA